MNSSNTVRYIQFIKESRYEKYSELSKKERNFLGLPPNKYFEQLSYLQMNPYTGAIEPEKVLRLQEELNNSYNRSVPGSNSYNWSERGPNNVPGRTRAILYDPNDSTHKRVFAGGVSGGLWVIDNIEDENSTWQRVNIPENLSVQCITVDVDNSNIFYLGTGESYVFGSVNGNGVWKSVDGGVTWNHVFGGVDGASTPNLTPGKFHVNDVITRNYNGVNEIYVAITESNFENSILGGAFGLYKSVDGGASWSLVSLPLVNNHRYAPNDLLVTSDNKLWVATTNSVTYNDGGGTVFSSMDGINFTLKYNHSSGRRTQIAASSTNPNLIYVLLSTGSTSIEFLKTDSGFDSGFTILQKPIDNDNQISSSDFTGGQSFYDLAIAVSPANDQTIILGGINTFKSEDGGVNWNKISWSRLSVNNISNIHSDIHSIVFHPVDFNKGLISNDGGVYYVNDWGNSQANPNAMEGRGINYNTTQFYKCAIGQNAFNPIFIAGAQDNGTQFFNNITNGVNSSETISEGDGMFCFIDKNGQYLISSYIYNNYYKFDMNGNFIGTIANFSNEGYFVNIADLDDNLDILYTNAYSNSNGALITRFSGIVNNTFTRTELSNALLNRPVSAMKVSAFSSTLFAGTDTGKLLKILNANSTPSWFNISSNLFVGSISSINFGANENEILVTFHNYGVINVFFTEDGGITWQNKEGDLPDLPVNDILMNPLLNDEVIIATDLGVWKTTNFKDFNPHWVRSQNGMQNVKVTSFDLRTFDNTILASTYGRGLFTGQFTATSTVSIDEFKNSNVINVYPTVSNGHLNITSSKKLDNSSLQVFDVSGKRVFDKTLDINSNDNQISLNVDKGIYFVNISNGNLHESHKIIIK